MASIINDPGGRKRILFIAAGRKRKAVRLGVVTDKEADDYKEHIEEMIAAGRLKRNPSPPTRVWLDKLDDTMHARLAAVGLVEERKPAATLESIAGPTLGVFLSGYLKSRPDVKPGTMLVMEQAKRWLVKFMGESKRVVTVTAADADAYRADLLSNKRARATVAKWCYYARHYFAVAKRHKLITENPFEHIKGAVRGNTARRCFVKADDVKKVIDAETDPQWRLLIALGRWGGLRVPTEALALKWIDVDFDRKRFTVRASKTEHHADEGIRIVPMFPELEPYFAEVFSADGADGEVYVISRWRDPAKNLRTRLTRAITAAGLTPWPKPWQNMRSTRATELADKYPSHVCAKWLGHTEAIADEFYRQVTDEHFARASGEAAHKAAHQQPEPSEKNQKLETADSEKPADIQVDSTPSNFLETEPVGAPVTEQTALFPRKSVANAGGGAQSGALRHGVASDLDRIITAWPTLTPAARARILAIIESPK